MSVPKISAAIKEQLQKILPSKDSLMEYRPCQVTLNNGQTLENVYISDIDSYRKVWGLIPKGDSAKRYISIEDVKEVKESPNRLPAHLATKLYDAGESGMGYCIFTILFKDGKRFATYTGNEVDFIELPLGFNKEDIFNVLPHEERKDNPQPGPEYYWCLYQE